MAVLDQTEAQIPVGLTPIPLGQAPSSEAKIPAGLTPIPLGSQQSSPNFGVKSQTQATHAVTPPADVKSSIPAGLTPIPKEDSHVDAFMAGIRKPAAYRQSLYDSTIKEGYTPAQAQKRQQEYDYALSQGMTPDNAYELAQEVRFDTGEKHILTDAEKVTAQAQFKDYALKQQQLNAAHGRNVSIPEKMVGTTPEEAEQWSQASARRYAYARAQGKTENESQEFAKGVVPQWVDNALATTGLSSDHSWILSDKGERNARFAVAKWADWLEQDHPTVGPYIGEIAKGLTDFGISLTTPSMVAITVGAAVTDGFSEVAPLARGSEAVEEATETEKATSLVGRWSRAVGKARAAAGKAATEKIPKAVGVGAGKAFGRLAPEEAAEASKVVGSAAENVEKATQAIQDAKLPVIAVKVARMMRDATHAYFSYQMAKGAVGGIKQSAEYAEKGDYPHAVSSFVVNTIISGLMAYGSGKGLVEREMFTAKADEMTERLYGAQKLQLGENIPEPARTKFADLNDYQQAVVLTKLIEEDPTYHHRWVETKAEHDRRMKKLAYRYSASLKQAWNPDAVKRMVRVIDDHQAANEWYGARQKAEDEARKHYLDQITKLIDLHKQDRADEEELATAEAERRAAAREGRPVRKTEAAKKREEARKVTLTNARQVAEARQGVGAARETAEGEAAEREAEAAQRPAEGLVRHPDVVTDDQGYESYRGRVDSGKPGEPEDHLFGKAQNKKGEWGVYRKSKGGVEYLSAEGVYEPVPPSGEFETPRYIAPDETTANVLAQINAERVNVDYALEQHGSTPEREAERSQLRNLERQLVAGKIAGEEARRAARLPEEVAEVQAKEKANHEIEAARAGALNGPLQGRTRAQYEDDMLKEAEAAGWEGADLEGLIDALPVAARDAAENNLHYVGRSGDWIASKKGVTWVLDSKGMLQPDDGMSAPIPLMKNGRYSTQAIDLAMSGRVGFGQRSWEDAKVEEAKEREANQQLENLVGNVADELQRAIELSKQNAGLQMEAGELPLERPAPKPRSRFAPPVEGQMAESPERETDRAVQEGHAAVQAEQRAFDEAWITLMAEDLAANHETPWQLIERVGKNSGLTGQQVLELYMERTAPKTVDGRIQRLKAGDTITDKMGLPWVVRADRNGTLYLRKGQGARIHVNKFKPSDDVRRIVGTGEVQPAPGPRWTPEDVRKAAYEPAYISRRLDAIEEVKERAENPPSEPRSPEQAEAQAQSAQVRATEVKGAAIVETVKASDLVPGTSLPEAYAAVDKAEETVQTAEQAEWQAIQAKAKTVSDKPFPPRAPITMGPQYQGMPGVIKHLGQSYAFHYAVVPLDSLVNSHVWDGNILIPNPDYDEALQPRTISEGRSGEIVLEAQVRQSETSKGFDFDYYGSKGIDPLNGPAIVEAGGRVAGGNTRIAMMRKHLEILEQTDDPEIERAKFRLQMAQLAHESGIKGIPDSDHDYVVVRMLDEPITTLRDASEKGMVFNASPSHDIGEAARGVALAKQLTDATLSDIGRMLDEHDTLGAAIAANPQVFTDIVTNELGVASTEHPLWFNETGKGKVLSEGGRRKFMQVLMGRVLDDTSVMDSLQGTPALTSIEKAVINIVRMKATKNAPMVEKIVEAIHAAKQTWDTGIAGEGIADRWAATYDPKATSFRFAVTDIPPTPDKVVEAIWRAIHAGSRTLSDRVKAYNETDRPSKSTGLDFTGAFEAEKQKLETPTELFNRVFAKEINKQPLGKPKDKITEAEFNAALENRGNLSDEAVADAKRSEEGKPPQEAPKPEGVSKKMFITKQDERDPKGLGWKQEQINAMKPEEAQEILSLGKQAPKGFKPPEPPAPKPEADLSAAKAEKGYVTPDELEKALYANHVTAKNAPEFIHAAGIMAQGWWDLQDDVPTGYERKDALAWLLREIGFRGIQSGEKGARGEYDFATGMMRVMEAADATTFWHEWFHAISPMLTAKDWEAVDTIEIDPTAFKREYGKKWEFPKWDKKYDAQGNLLMPKGKELDGLREKLSYGSEKYHRDENLHDFHITYEAREILKKIKKLFVETYKKWLPGDPLSPFKLSEEAKGLYDSLYGVEGHKLSDDWNEKVKEARKAEAKQKKGMVKPEEALHPIIQIAKDLGPTPTHISRGSEWPIVESDGDRVAYEETNNTVVLEYPDEEKAAHAYVQATMEGSGISGVEELKGPDGKFAIRFNWGLPEKGSKEKPKEIPNSILYQEVPKRNEQLQIEKLEALLKKTSSPLLQSFLTTQIKHLESEIRAKYGVESPKIGPNPELAKQAITEVRNAKGKTESGRPGVSNLRGVPNGPLGAGQQGGTGRLSRPPVMGMPRHAGAGGAADRNRPGGGSSQPVNLANVTPVRLQPFERGRGTPVGILAGEKFDEKVWRDGLKRAGLPENMPAPTVTLSPEVARTLKYAGQKQIVQTVLSALEQGDGAVIASVAGSGKTWTEMGVVKETILRNPDAKVLVITMNRGLLEEGDDAVRQVAKNGYDLKVETDILDKPPEPGVYGATYQRLLNNSIYAQTQWDLVIADESGAARNWYRDENQQGKLLKAVMDNAKKGVYVSATPFHSPNEYGYAEKLNLWPKGGFEDWIKNNFAHEKIGDKVVAKLDPAKQAKLREQMVERGQFISQQISYDGFSVHFGVVPVTDVIERKLDRIHQGIAVMKRELLKQGKKGLSERVSAFEATYTKAFLERSRLPEAIEVARKARAQGWQVAIFSETTSEDLFRRPVGPKEEPGTYRQLDEETGGQISRIMPEFPNIADELKAEFGDEMGDYSGVGNTDAQREEAKQAFLKGKKPVLYTSYAAGGIGINLQDKDGDKPRISIFLGPPYSGILLEQSLARTWRLGVKSNARAVFLATDSEPDIRLMATKIGPRMRALSAAVLGERDSLASVMANYTDEEKMREHQDMLAFEQGNEVKVDAQGFQVRSKRKVNFDNWSSIDFPSAEEAKNKGMQVEMSGGGKGSDWATLYQEKPKRWEPPNRPLTIEDIRIRRAVNAAADKAAENPQIPHEEITMTAVRAEEVAKAAPEGIDKEAAARDAVAGHLKGIGYVQDPLTGEWRAAEEIHPAESRGEPEEKYRAGLGMISSQEQNLLNLDRQMNTGGAGRELVTKTRRYTAMTQRELADRRTDFTKLMQENGLNPHDDKVMRDIFDVVMGKRAVADPRINKAAGQVSAMMAKIHQMGAAGKLAVRTPDGRMIPWSDFQDDPSYMPRIADWNAKFTDGDKTYTPREIMGGTFGELKAKELLAKKLREEGSSLSADRAYELIKRERMRAPVQGNIHRTNEVNFPFIRKDYGALDNYFKQFAKAMATEAEFGSDLRKLQKEIGKIPNKQARTDVESMFGYMFTPQNWDTDLGRVYNTVAAMETATKMTFSAVKVLFHAANAPMVMGGKVMPIVKALGHLAGDWKKTRENGYFIGAVTHGIDPAVMYMPETKMQHLLFKVTGFEYLYNLGRSIAGESARVYLDQYAMDDLKKGGNTETDARRLLKNTFLIGDHAIDEAVRAGRWNPEDYKLAQVAFANESLYGDNPLQMPGFARQRIAGEGLSTTAKRLHMALRASYSLQSFSVKTYSMLREHLYDEVVLHHNLKPLAYAMVVAPVIGQMLQGASAGAKGGVHRLAQYGFNKPHTEDAWDKWLAQFTGLKEQPAAAFLKLYLDGICSQWALERTKRLSDALFNIAIGDKVHLKTAGDAARYFLPDEIEQDIGPIWTDTVMRPMEFVGDEIGAAAESAMQKLKGKPGSFLSRTEKNVVRNTEELSPLLRQEPHVEEYLAPKKSTGKWAVP